MGDRPIADTAAELDSVADVVRREIENVKSVVTQHADRTIRAVYPAQQHPRTAGLPDEIAAVARRMSTELDRVGEGIDSTIKAEIDQLNSLLGESPPLTTAPVPPAVAPVEATMPRPARSYVGQLFAAHARVLKRILKQTFEPKLGTAATYAPAACTVPASLTVDTPRQGEIGNCYFVAALCAVAYRAPHVVLKSVHMEGETVVVTVPGRRYQLEQTLPAKAGTNQVIYARSPDMSTLVPYLEKAYAQHLGGYPKMGRGGYANEPLAWLTGGTGQMALTEANDGAALQELMSTDRPMVASTWLLDHTHPAADEARTYGLVEGGHAYAVLGVDTDGQILLHNPWGIRHPKPIPVDAFRKLFAQVEWCEIP